MLENKHELVIRLHGSDTRIYESKNFAEVIEAELGPIASKERLSLFKQLKPLTNLWKKDWVGTVCVTNDTTGYSEALSYNHVTDVTAEISILLSQAPNPELDGTPMHVLDEYEFLDDARRYTVAMADKHTTELIDVYLDVMKNLVKHYGHDCVISRSVNRLIHSFVIRPRKRTDNKFYLRVILVPRRRERNMVTHNSILQ